MENQNIAKCTHMRVNKKYTYNTASFRTQKHTVPSFTVLQKYVKLKHSKS